MKASELRIGNLLSDGGNGYRVVSEIHELYYSSGSESILIRDAKPIPLTEEWFDKFEFMRYSEIGYPHRIIGNFDVSGPINNLILEHIRVSPKIQYVHQLQNLYFALTDKELEIK